MPTDFIPNRPGLRTRIFGFLALMGFLMLLLFIPDIPQGTHLWRELLDAGHALLFGALTVTLIWTARGSVRFRSQRRLRQFLWVASPLFILGIATEIIQPFFGRDGEVIDVVRDSIGILGALCTLLLIESYRAAEGEKLGSHTLWVLRTILLVLFLGVFQTTGAWVMAYAHRDRVFPVLVSYESATARKFIQRQHASIHRCPNPVPGADRTDSVWAKITFDNLCIYPTITVDELYHDWTGYDSLTFDLYSVASSPATVSLRIEDATHAVRYEDRFNTRIAVTPGLNHCAYSLEQIAQAPATRRMALEKMGRILLFTRQPMDTVSIFISPIRLK
jgi:VanZ family protein